MEVGIPAGYVPTGGKRTDTLLENKAAKSPKVCSTLQEGFTDSGALRYAPLGEPVISAVM